MSAYKRLDYLDSIRGLAALMVVFSHCWLSNPDSFFAGVLPSLSDAISSPSSLLFYSLMKFFDLARVAVMTFFVLSGFVLAFSLLKKPLPYANYAVKRIFRIYPAFFVVVVISYFLHTMIGFHDVNSEYLKENADLQPSVMMLIKHLAMTGTPGSRELDRAVWSLIHEMRISLIFPFMLLALQKYRLRGVMLFWAASALCAFGLLRTGGNIGGFVEDTFVQSLMATGSYLVFFAGGAYLALERDRIVSKVKALPIWGLALFAITILLCFAKSDYGDHSLKSVCVDYLRGIGAMGVIVLTMSVPQLARALSHRVPVWLGRISYSLYLVHLPIIYVVTQTFGAEWSVLQSSVVAIALSLLAAEIMARFVEFPLIKVGKTLQNA